MPRSRFTHALIAVSVSALTLIGFAHARPPVKPAPIIYARYSSPLPESDLHRDARWNVDLVVRGDGAVSGRDGRHLATLTPRDLRVLRRELRATRFVVQSAGIDCDALPARSTRIRTDVGELSWSSPCAARPHVSVLKLEMLVRDLVSARSAPPIPHPELEP